MIIGVGEGIPQLLRRLVRGLRPRPFRFGREDGVDGVGGIGCVAGIGVCFRSVRFSSVSLSVRSFTATIRTLGSSILRAVSFAADKRILTAAYCFPMSSYAIVISEPK